MKKVLIFSIILLILGGAGLFYDDAKQPVRYVMFASAENLHSESREALINRLQANRIPYQVDSGGNVKIPEKEVNHAVMCCS